MMTRLHAMLSAVLIATFAGWPVGLLAADVPLIDAVTRGERATIRALLDQGVDVNAPQGDGATALHWAVHLNDHETVSALLDAGAEVDATNDLQVAPLLIAATSGDAAVVRLLLDAGADPNGGPPERERPLMRAAWVGTVGVVTALLDAGADPNGASAEQGGHDTEVANPGRPHQRALAPIRTARNPPAGRRP